MLPDWRAYIWWGRAYTWSGLFSEFYSIYCYFLIGASPFELRLSQELKVLIYGVI